MALIEGRRKKEEGRRKKEEGKEQVLILRIYDSFFPATSQSFLFPIPRTKIL
ncbi:hypothetical protein IQ269_19625 [Tychonema sp. LEGE 07199]|uniref:hypothetical protein n=1 Tax=unclassified Tychonema TaxID=2642144 RepID=UPI001882C2BD|nr:MULTISPECIES: hypothetical protein [unclassified Tychonema]MBE9122947.1 hypothetical protein [Tychonema sp. LEGE 07199]MBE9131427.1 hypothetical protein [Tychonema sp. LEGE 07196]